MAEPLTGSFPDSLMLGGSYVIQFTALSPTTGAVVSGVTVSSATLTVDAFTDTGVPGITGPTEIDWLNLAETVESGLGI